MKTFALLAALLAGPLAPAFGGEVVYTEDLINNATLGYSKNTDLDTSQYGIDQISFQMDYSSVTMGAYTYDDGTVGSASMTVVLNGGASGAKLVIGSWRLDEGLHWTAGTKSSNTALNIAAAINSQTGLRDVVVATCPVNGTVVFATATVAGVAGNYALFSSTNTTLRWWATAMAGGADSDVSVANDTIYLGSNPMTTGFPVWLELVSGTIQVPLVNKTTYYVSYCDGYNVKLATTAAQAVTGDTIDISSQAAAGGGSFKVWRTGLTGTPGWQWQGSNDGTTFSNIVGISTFTYSVAGSTLTNVGNVLYRYLRVKFNAGTAGGLNLKATGFGKKN